MLLHKEMPSFSGKSEIDVMLTPQLYTIKREVLPVKYHYQAKKLAPSILENLLESGREYDYFVFKDNSSWSFIAYEPSAVSALMESKGILPEQVGKLYFVQQARSNFQQPVALGEQEALVSVGETVVVVPKSIVEEKTEYQDFQHVKTPRNGVSFGAGIRSFITRKEMMLVTAILTFFTLMFIAEGVRYAQATNNIREGIDEMLAEYPSLQSSYARENIAKKYQRIDREERHKREVLKSLSRMVLPGVDVVGLSLDQKHFSTQLKYPDEKSALRIKGLAEAQKYIFRRKGSDNVVEIEGKL